jgi:hypothetical protein
VIARVSLRSFTYTPGGLMAAKRGAWVPRFTISDIGLKVFGDSLERGLGARPPERSYEYAPPRPLV